MPNINHYEIRVRAFPTCYVCGSDGVGLYRGLRDRLFGAEGQWNLSKCPKCGLVWLNPMPIEEDISKAYRNYYTHRDDTQTHTSQLMKIYRRAQKTYASLRYGYNRGNISWTDRVLAGLISAHPGRRADAAFKVFYLPRKLDGKLLEIGCGNGTMLSSMQEFGWTAQGVDFDPNAVQVARDRGLNVQLGTLKDQGYQNESFDALVMVHVIEHLSDPRDLLRECYRILKVGGHLIVVTPNASSWGHKLYGQNWRGLEPPRHLRIFTISSIKEMAVQAGFSECECRTTVRGARGMFLGSMSLERIKGSDSSVTFTMIDKIKVEMMEMAEGIGLMKDVELGEELTLSSVKLGTH